jgi:hypothetical protein
MRLRPGVPVLHLGEGVIQIGLRDPLVLHGVCHAEAHFLASLEGRSVPVSSSERRDFPESVCALERHPHLLWREDPMQGWLASVVVRWRGCGLPALEAARILALAGVRTMSAVDPRPVLPADPYSPSLRGLPRSEAFARAVADTGAEVRWVSRESPAHIEVLSAHGTPDLVATRDLLARDVVHLLIVSDEDGLTVGPVVVPGVTACAGCLAHARSDRDPRWPRIALQLGGAARDGAAHLPPECSSLAGALAAREVLATLRGERRASGQWRIPTLGEASWSPAQPHEACGCGAARDVGDAAAAAVARMPRGRA